MNAVLKFSSNPRRSRVIRKYVSITVKQSYLRASVPPCLRGSFHESQESHVSQ
jgi:hypothetical protein